MRPFRIVSFSFVFFFLLAGKGLSLTSTFLATGNLVEKLTLDTAMPTKPADAGPDQNICGSTTTTLAGNNPADPPPPAGTGLWSKVSGPGIITFTNVALYNTTISASLFGSYVLRWTVNDGLESVDEVTINFYAIPTITGTTPGSRCGTGTVILGATASAGIIDWYPAPSGGISIGTGTSFTTPIIAVTTTYYVNATANGCTTGSRTPVVATVNNTPAPTGSTTQNFCTADNPTVADLTVTGTGIKWYLTATGGIALLTTTPLVTDIYYASQTVGGCESATRLAVNVTVNNPSAPTGVSPQNFCAINNPTVANLVAAGTGIKWYLTATGGIALLSTTPLVTDIYYASQTVGSCESTSRLTVSVTVNNPSAPTGVSPQNFCAINNPTVANLTAVGTGIKWYLTPTGGIALATTTALVLGNYYASQTVAGCESTSRLAVFVTVNNPSAPTGPSPQDFCAINNPTVANLIVLGTGIQWYLAPTGGIALASTTALVTRAYYASQTVSGCESSSRLSVAVTVNNPSAPTGSTTQNFCTTDNPTVVNLTAIGTSIKWYLVSTGGIALVTTTPLVTDTYYASQTVGGCESSLRLAVVVTVDNPSAPTGVSPQNFCLISNPTVANLVATGTGIKWYLTSTGGTALATTTALVTGTYYASQTVGSCESTLRLAVSVTVNNPAAPTGTSPQIYCTINNPTVANLTAAGTGIKWYLTSTGGTALATTTALVTGTYYASQTVGVCESSSRLAVVVTVDNPSAPTGLSPQSYCTISNPTVANLTATGSGIQWYLTSTGGTALATTTALVTGVYYASQTVGSCESTLRLAVVVTVNNPAAPTGIASQIFCTINNPTVANLTATGTGIQWYLTSVGGIALPTTTVLVTGTYYASQTVGGCESTSRLAVVVTVNNPAAPTGTATQIFCTINNPTVTNLTATGTGILWYLTSTGGTALASTTPLVTGTYYASQTVGGCESVTRFAVAVTVNQTPISNAGSGGDECDLNFNLNATPASVGTGLWTQTTGPGIATFSPNASTPNATVTVSVYGTYTFTWTVVSNNCTTASTITVNFYQQPVANAGTGGIECDLNFVLNAVPSVGTGLWTMVTGPGTAIFAPNANTPGATVTISPYGTYTFRWTETNGSCSSSSVITVNFYQQPIANAGTGGNECDLNFVLNAVPSVGTGTWTMTSGTGTATFSPNANTPSATVTVSTYGAKIFTWTEVNGTCTNSSTITVNFYQQPVANAGTGGNNCGVEFNLMAAPSIGTGTWTRDSGPGSATFSPNANTSNAKVTVNAYGTYIFRWTEVNGTCSNSATISVIFIQQPSANAGNGGDECDKDFILNAVPGAVPGIWTKVSGPGSVVFSPDANQANAKVTVTQFGSYDFAWTEVNSLCTSADIIRVTFHDLPSINAGADVAVCKGSSIQLNALGSGSFLWTPANLLNNPAISNPLATPVVTSVFTVTLTDQWGCKNSDQVSVEVREQPVANAGPDQVLEYLFETTLNAAVLGNKQTGEWTIISGTGEFADKNDHATYVSKLSLVKNSFKWTVTNGVCPISSDTVNIIVHDLIIPTLITPNKDGKNEYFIIRGVESLGKTELIVFNRWGARVYKNSNYDNKWDGVDNNDDPLPDDTYFFVLKPEKSKSVSGYIVIRR